MNIQKIHNPIDYIQAVKRHDLMILQDHQEGTPEHDRMYALGGIISEYENMVLATMAALGSKPRD